MFIGHDGVALAAKKIEPKLSLGWLLCLILIAGCAGSRQMRLEYGESQYKYAIDFSTPNIAKLANNPAEPPFLNGWPRHSALGFSDLLPLSLPRDGILPLDEIAFEEFDPQQRQLRVFEIKKYRAIFHGAEREEFDKRLSDLQAALHGDATRFPEILPAVEAYPAFHVNIATVCGDGWKGIRNVTMYVQDNCLVENGRLFYTMQGLSNDERYWIAAYWPVTASNLPTLDHQITHDELETLNSPAAYTAYLVGMITQLEQATYTPPLDEIDEMTSGLKLTE
ncbi:MAG: hypothetical protein IPG71_03265 [bacterium]|nr:hypothetical protein [bacterium]